ncbi:MAG: hypothetical protein AB7I37_10795 [Pirellulales bacterium]
MARHRHTLQFLIALVALHVGIGGMMSNWDFQNQESADHSSAICGAISLAVLLGFILVVRMLPVSSRPITLPRLLCAWAWIALSWLYFTSTSSSTLKPALRALPEILAASIGLFCFLGVPIGLMWVLFAAWRLWNDASHGERMLPRLIAATLAVSTEIQISMFNIQFHRNWQSAVPGDGDGFA